MEPKDVSPPPAPKAKKPGFKLAAPLAPKPTTAYRSEYARQVVEFMAQGFSLTAWAGSIGASIKTVSAWRRMFDDFDEAVGIGMAKCQLYWETMGHELARGEIRYGNASVWIYNMKYRFAWRDRPDQIAELEKPVGPTEVKLDSTQLSLLQELKDVIADGC